MMTTSNILKSALNFMNVRELLRVIGMCQIHPRLVRLLARFALMEDSRICHHQTPRMGRWRLGSARVPDGDRQGLDFCRRIYRGFISLA
jgi:hypothetical protein